MAPRSTSLRRVFSIGALALTLLAGIAAASLVLSTTVLERATADVAAAVSSVHATEEAEITLLLHARATDPIVQRELEHELRERLATAAEHVTTAQEARALARATDVVDRYLTISRDPDTRPDDVATQEGNAYDALEHVVEINLAVARDQGARAIAWSRFGDVAGVAVGIAMLALTTACVVWLRRRVIRPLVALAGVMQRFGKGDRSARAVEQGPVELAHMARRFNAMADSLATQRQAQVAFLGGVAHDLRNPLSALRLGLDVLDPSQPLPPEPALRRTIALVARQIDHLERMVGDFVDTSRIEAGELRLAVASHDVLAITRETLELFPPEARARIRVETPDRPVVIRCDAGRITQVVMNLVSNALKYSPEGTAVAVAVSVAPAEIVIEVTDRGSGIPRDDHQRVFEPFHRSAIHLGVHGTGLGLYNVRRIVEAHGGAIEVESVVGAGSTFRVRLPRQARDAATTTPRVPGLA